FGRWYSLRNCASDGSGRAAMSTSRVCPTIAAIPEPLIAVAAATAIARMIAAELKTLIDLLVIACPRSRLEFDGRASHFRRLGPDPISTPSPEWRQPRSQQRRNAASTRIDCEIIRNMNYQ